MQEIKNNLNSKLKEYVAIILDEYHKKMKINNILNPGEDSKERKINGIKNSDI